MKKCKLLYPTLAFVGLGSGSFVQNPSGVAIASASADAANVEVQKELDSVKEELHSC